jgi:hypothetical protein
MSGDQDWCLQCGAGAPGSLDTHSWRSAATILGLVLVLVLGAAAAAYAALTDKAAKPAPSSTTVARVVTPPPTTTPTATTPPPTTTPAPTPTATAPAPTTPTTAVKPPKIPLTAVVPKTPSTTTTGSSDSGTSTSTPTFTPPPTQSTGGNTTSEESGPAAILLDTNAASTYNPYSYPATLFGDPSLAIDGDHSTGWTAAVESAAAPKMAVGLMIDLKEKQKLSSVQLITTTPGMTVQLYGANGATAPTSITDPAWVALSHSTMVKKSHVRIKLRTAGKTFTFVTLWISSAPTSSTAADPGRVTVNELELFPAS